MKNTSFLILTLVALGLAFWSCQRGEAQEQTSVTTPAREVSTAEIRQVKYAETVFASGRLSSTEESKLSFKTGGIIKRVLVREGQQVRRGQLLAELDLDEISAQTQQARLGEEKSSIDIENAALAVRLAERDLKNVQGLYRDSVATLVQLQNAEIALENARNQLKAAQTGQGVSEQRVTVANYNLRHSKITAPANGVILRRLAEPNELTGAGTPVLLFGAKEQMQLIKVNLTDKDIIHIQLGDTAAVRFDAYPYDRFRGTVREIAGMADPVTGTYEVEIAVDAGNKRLLNGFIGTVDIYTQGQQRLWQIPVDALFSANGKQGKVFVVKDETAHLTSITIATMKEDYLLADGNFDAGTQVVISGAGYLEDRQRVSVNTDPGESQGLSRD